MLIGRFTGSGGDKELEANGQDQLASSSLSPPDRARWPIYITAQGAVLAAVGHSGVDWYENSPARLSRCAATAPRCRATTQPHGRMLVRPVNITVPSVPIDGRVQLGGCRADRAGRTAAGVDDAARGVDQESGAVGIQARGKRRF